MDDQGQPQLKPDAGLNSTIKEVQKEYSREFNDMPGNGSTAKQKPSSKGPALD